MYEIALTLKDTFGNLVSENEEKMKNIKKYLV